MQQLPEPQPHREKSVVPVTYTEVPYSPPPGLGTEPENGGLLEYWRMLRRHKGTLILVASIGTLIGFLVTIPQTPIYQAHTSLEIVSLNQNFLNAQQSNPLDEGAGSYDSNVDIQTQVKIMQSASLLDRVLAKLGSTPVGFEPTGRVAAWRKVLNLPDPEPVNARERAVRYAKKSLKVRATGQTRIVEATVDSTDPGTAVEFANTLANEFIDQSLESRWKTMERTSDFLTRQLDDMRIRLERSEDRLQGYARQAGLLFTSDEKTNVSEQKLLQVQQALSTAQTDRISKQSRWEMATSSPPEALPDILNDASLRDYQAKLTELQRHLAELRETYTPEHPKVKQVQAQIAPIQAALDRERADILKRIRNEYDEALRRETLLTADYASQRGIVTGESDKAIQYNIFKHEVDSNRQLYDAMLQQLKQASLASALRASNIRVVDPAQVPKGPYKPDVLLSSGLGLFSGLFLGAVFVVMRERADRSIQDPGETALYLNLPELGIIPAEASGPRVRLRIAAHKGLAESPAGESGVPAARQRVELATFQRKPSAVAESFRATLVSILFSGENGSRPRIMVVTSAGMGEGKSTVVSNLGIAVAEVNHKVLLIDADLRKPRLHDIFGLNNDRGLSDLLRSKDAAEGLPEGIIQETSVPDLYVLTSGQTSSVATSLLYSNRMPELLRRLRGEFETIFLDTPPMLQIPDARVLGRMVDRVILVVRSGKTTRDAAQAAYQRFSEDGTKVLGTILNDWNPKHSANGYYGYSNGYNNGYYRNGYYGSKTSEK
jgi:capsular exopolysaccharide synthesis family protein